jgi:hypothetical protein
MVYWSHRSVCAIWVALQMCGWQTAKVVNTINVIIYLSFFFTLLLFSELLTLVIQEWIALLQRRLQPATLPLSYAHKAYFYQTSIDPRVRIFGMQTYIDPTR